MSVPWGDWQFWVVTAVALGGLLALLRPLLPRKTGAPEPGCSHCAGCPPTTEPKLVALGGGRPRAGSP
ncbi:MAG: hypothetical protein SF066_12450 [Thermoanaerobaculia bacterium]|nr:hypothetical protein [Thermoanaerobaculia bacterium]